MSERHGDAAIHSNAIKHSKLLPYFFRGSYLFNMVFLNTSNFVTTPSSECVEGMAMPRFTATQKPRAMHPARTKIYKTTFKIFVLVHYMLIQFLWSFFPAYRHSPNPKKSGLRGNWSACAPYRKNTQIG